MRENMVEVLAPAGSYDILMAVLAAGADAVYLGGSMFGARAYANNFSQDELLRALDYAHLHDKKIYLTVNTLMKENEISERLVEYLHHFYEAGLDAVIVQDFGTFRMIKKYFPDMHIHASTQMTATGAKSAALLKSMGASRVVMARELSLYELSSISRQCDVEIESFVHGALCYCYSGQCLLSSFNGTRSGNRGRCAQPCRLMYDYGDKNKGYILSPKDMCGLTILPDIIEAGVYSLKIEGRMKNVNYAAGVTAMYRKYADMYMERGRAGYSVAESDINDLMDLYNRGAFTTGYYNNSKGKEMISLSRPNHMGTRALRVSKNISGRVTFEALEDIYAQDVFEIDKDNSFESGSMYRKGERFTVNLPKRYALYEGRVVYRVKNGELTRNIIDKYTKTQLKKKLDLKLNAVQNEPLRLEVTDKVTGISVVMEKDAVQQALKQPAQKEKIAAQLAAMGDTDFEAENININMPGDVFIPVGQLKGLRREALEQLEQKLVAAYRRKFSCNETDSRDICNSYYTQTPNYRKPHITILVKSIPQAEEAYMIPDIIAVYYDFNIFLNTENGRELLKESIRKCAENNKEFVIALPHILREKNRERIEKLVCDAMSFGADTFLARGLEELGMLNSISGNKTGKELKVIADCSLYTWNSESVRFLKEMCSHVELIRTTYPLEQTAGEFVSAGICRELVVYTHIPLMISEQCVRKTTGQCDAKGGQLQISSGQSLYNVHSVCSMCYSVIYDTKQYDISDMQELIAKVNPYTVRYELTDEKESVGAVFAGRDKNSKMTRGHFELGVE